jgi:hypothetical protein
MKSLHISNLEAQKPIDNQSIYLLIFHLIT